MPKKKPVGDGAAAFFLTTDPANGFLLINFERAVRWFALTPEVAKKLGKDLIENAEQIERLLPKHSA